MASTLFVSKNDHIFIWDYCLLILWKHFWEDEISPGSQLPEKPWSMLAMEGGALFQPSCTHTSCQHSCLLWGMDLLSLWPCSLRAYLSLGKSEFYAHYLGLHVYLVKSMRFIQVANPDGKWPGAMVVWPLELLYVACFHRDSPRALLPSLHRALFHAVLQVLPEMQWHLHPTPRKQETPWYEARPPWRASGNRTIRPLNDSDF